VNGWLLDTNVVAELAKPALSRGMHATSDTME
jgi:hypothetical protein